MTTLASGSRVRMTYIAESTPGINPYSSAGDTTVLRSTSRNINLEIESLRDNEIKSNRQRKVPRHGFNRVSGSIGIELGMTAYDAWIAAAMAGAWSAITMSGTPNLTVTSNVIARDAGSWVTDGFRPGDIVAGTSFAQSGTNAQFRLSGVTATNLTVHSETTLVDETIVAASVDLVGKRCDIGTTLSTFSMERGFLDTGDYQMFTGVGINTADVQIQPNAKPTLNFGVLGMAAAAMTATAQDSAPVAAADSDPFASFDGTIYDGGTSTAICTGLNFTLDNERSLEGVVGSKYSPTVFEGRVGLTGTITRFFEDIAAYNKFVNETSSSIWMKLNDIGGTDFHNLVMPDIVYTGGTMDPPASGPIVLTMPFEAGEDSTFASLFSWQRSNA